MNSSESGLKTVTFFFSDIEGSTKLIHKLGEKYGMLLDEQQRIVRNIVSKNRGEITDTAGDGFFCIFDSASDAVIAAVEIQKETASYKWVNDSKVKLRIGIHTGEARKSESGYVGLDVHKASRIMSAGHGRQILVSDTTNNLIENELKESIKIILLGEYMLKDLNHPEKIYQINYPGAFTDFPELKSYLTEHTNLPQDIVKLIGREKDLEYLENILLNSGERLVTITGPGGMGKTSLALNLCRNLLKEFKDGVYAVYLSSVSEAGMIAETISVALNVKEKFNCDENFLFKYLKSKNVLLLLDNFEQITDASSFVSKLISECPGIKIIITSRIPLRIKSESEYILSPLSLPSDREISRQENLSGYSSIKLFEERARRVNKDFQITPENETEIADICIQLDGLPLAIELACARIKIFTPSQLLSRLSSKLNLLKASSSDLPARHQTLRNTILWSYDLLNENEKLLFESLSVFNGGCSLDAVNFVCSDLFDSEIELFDTLQNLAEKSLIRREENEEGNLRFTMLSTIYEFSNELLSKNITLFKKLKRKHSEYFINLTEEAEKHLTGKDLKHWLDIIESETGNIRSSIKRAESTGDTETALKYCAAMWRFWVIRGNLNNDYKQVRNILSMAYDAKLKPLRAKVLNGIGTMVHELSNFEVAYPLIEESLELYKELNDVKGIIDSLVNLSWVTIHLGELDKALEMCNEALHFNKDTGDKRVYALIHNNLGWLNLMKGNFSEAKKNYSDSFELRKTIEDKRGVSFALTNLAWVESYIGNYTDSEIHFNQSLEIVKGISDKQLIGWTLSTYGFLELFRNNIAEAEIKITEAIKLMTEVYNEWGMTYEYLLLGIIRQIKNDSEGAIECINKGLEFFSQSGSKWGLERALIAMANVLIMNNDLKAAAENLTDAFIQADYLKDKYGYIQILETYALIFTESGQKETALMIYSASDRLRKIINCPMSIYEMKLHKIFTEENKDKYLAEVSFEEAISLCRNIKI